MAAPVHRAEGLPVLMYHWVDWKGRLVLAASHNRARDRRGAGLLAGHRKALRSLPLCLWQVPAWPRQLAGGPLC